MMNSPPSHAWSYSSLSMFEQCPKKFYHLRVAKDVVDKPFDASEWGNRAHKALEDYGREGTPLIPGTEQFAPLVDKLNALPGQKLYEFKFGVTANLEPTQFFGKDVWCRGIIDFAAVSTTEAVAIDYKTGKKKFDFDQMSLFAGSLFAHFPNVESIRAAYLWLKTGELTRKTFTREDARGIWAHFIPRVRRVDMAYDTGKFPAKPSPLCGWCPVTTCNHWVKR